MKGLNLIVALAAALLSSSLATAAPMTYGGVLFPDGEISFADHVVSYVPGGDVGPGWDDPAEVLGAPDGAAASLGDFGELIVQFTNNSLTASGDSSADLHIFEIGAVVEWMNVAISTDNVTYIEVANALGQPTSIDIDAVAGVLFGVQYSFVRLRDISPNQTGYPYGEADIDAIGAISSAPPVTVPEPGALSLLLFSLLGLALRRNRR